MYEINDVKKRTMSYVEELCLRNSIWMMMLQKVIKQKFIIFLINVYKELSVY